jgi:two-component system nitrogen regulation sensor histidine kinase GlnL
VRPPDERPDPGEPFAAHPVATLLVDGDNCIAAVNPRAETLLNMARSALVGSAIGRVVRLADKDLAATIWSNDKPVSAYDLRVHAGRVAEMEIDVLIAPMPDRDGWRVIALHPHSHARKIAFGRAGRSSRSAMGAAAMLAHEIKNPLSGIRGAAQLLESGGDAESTGALTRLICQEVDRIAALIDRMQDFTTDRPLACAAANIYPLLDRAIDVAGAGFARAVPIQRDYDPSLPPAIVNGDALVQVMINLLKNAAEALDGVAGGQIHVTTAFRHGLSLLGERQAALPIEVQVVDNGPGVPDHLRDELFAPFVTGRRSGQGLGLALVDKLVRDMNGIVQYERQEAAGLTIFRLLLPMGAAG